MINIQIAKFRFLSHLPEELFTPFKQQKEKEREAEFWKRREIPKQPRVQTPVRELIHIK